MTSMLGSVRVLPCILGCSLPKLEIVVLLVSHLSRIHITVFRVIFQGYHRQLFPQLLLNVSFLATLPDVV